jgi:hypothetical protein
MQYKIEHSVPHSEFLYLLKTDLFAMIGGQKVADFGLAKLTNDSLTHISTRVMGTFG